jgi:hypothetical protein
MALQRIRAASMRLSRTVARQRARLGFMASGKEPSEIGLAEFRKILYHDANWDWRTFNFDKGIALAEKVDDNTITANDSNLKSPRK